MTYKDYWRRQHAAQTKAQRIQQLEGYIRELEAEIKSRDEAASGMDDLLDLLSDLSVDVEKGFPPTESVVRELAIWYERRLRAAA